MNEETVNEVINTVPWEQIAQTVLDWMRAAGDLAAEQAPLLAEEIILRGYVNCVEGLLVGVMLLAVAGFGWRSREGLALPLSRRIDDLEPDRWGGQRCKRCGHSAGVCGCATPWWILTVGSPALATASSIIILDYTFAAIRIVAAPRVYLLEVLSRWL